MSTVSRVPPSRRRPRRGSRTLVTVAGSSGPPRSTTWDPPPASVAGPSTVAPDATAAGRQILGQAGGVPALDQEPRHPAGRRVPELLRSAHSGS